MQRARTATGAGHARGPPPAAVELSGGVDGSEPVGTLGGHDERGPRMRVELGIGPPRCARQLERLQPVVRGDLGVVLASLDGELLDPLGGLAVLARA